MEIDVVRVSRGVEMRVACISTFFLAARSA